MKKILLSLLIAVVATPAMAQDTVTSRGDVARPAPTFEGLITAMTKTSATIDELTKRQMINDADILVVDAKPLLEGKGDEMLKVQLDKNKESLKQLHDVLSKHPAIEARLKKESANPSVSEIIAAEITADGKIQLFYQKV
jgi:hypothetical protein